MNIVGFIFYLCVLIIIFKGKSINLTNTLIIIILLALGGYFWFTVVPSIPRGRIRFYDLE